MFLAYLITELTQLTIGSLVAPVGVEVHIVHGIEDDVIMTMPLLVIVDEAHHLRNGSMEKDKAFAYKCVHYFCQHADAVVIDKKSFTMMSRPNPYISQCAHIVRAAKENWKAEALETLDSVLTTQWGENVIANNPVFEQIRKVLRQDTITREERVKLMNHIMGIMDGVVMRIGLAWLLGSALNLGITSCWYGSAIAGFTFFAVGAPYDWSGIWKKRRPPIRHNKRSISEIC